MKTVKKEKIQEEALKKGFSVNKDLNKYSKMDLFKDKVEKTNHILKTVGLPKGW